MGINTFNRIDAACTGSDGDLKIRIFYGKISEYGLTVYPYSENMIK